MNKARDRGNPTPIRDAGAQTDAGPASPEAPAADPGIGGLRGVGHALLIGLTGSIATGKTSVAEMLEQLGARTIDFDLLSRRVVEPDRPAWREIVAFFGEEILLQDRTLDRDRLREVVFRDPEKKKKLESFTHPRIGEEFLRLVQQHVSEDPNAIIQVIVPLLVETHTDRLFHHTLMVYAPEQEQKRRLIERDGLSEEMAMKMIRSQLSVEQKKGCCDLIIDNSGSLEETRRQVNELWPRLLQLQQERKTRREAGE